MVNSCTVLIHNLTLSPKLEQMCVWPAGKPHKGPLLCWPCHRAPLAATTAVSCAPIPAGLGRWRLCLIKRDGTIQLAKCASFRAFTSPNGALLCLLHKKMKKRFHKKSHVSQLRPQISSVVAQRLSVFLSFFFFFFFGCLWCSSARDQIQAAVATYATAVAMPDQVLFFFFFFFFFLWCFFFFSPPQQL